MSRNSEPAAAVSMPNRSMTDGNTAPSVVSTIPNDSMPRQAIANRVRRLVMSPRCQCEARGAEQPRITAECACHEAHLPQGNGLRPPCRLDANTFEKANRRAEHATAEHDGLRVEQTHEVGRGHPPELDGVMKHARGEFVAAVVGGEEPRRRHVARLEASQLACVVRHRIEHLARDSR